MLSFIFLNHFMTHYGVFNNMFLRNLIGSSLSLLILGIAIYYFSKLIDIKNYTDKNEFWYFIIHPVISIIIIYAIMASEVLTKEPYLSILLIIAVIAYNITTCIGYTKIIKSKNMQIEVEKFKSKLRYHSLLEEKFDSSKRFIHDYKKHINILKGYLDSEDYIKLASYFKEISADIRSVDTFIVTGNQLVDLALNGSKKILEENSIEVKYDINIREIKPVNDYDFNIVFSNILENAIESCKRSKEGFIKIKLDKSENLIVLKIINTCHYSNVDLSTLKSDNAYHGCGIEIIQKIVKKYQGHVNFKHDRENNIFISTVVFNK